MPRRGIGSRLSTFHAKAEDNSSKPTWKGPTQRGRRCSVLTDVFYEWKVLDPDAKKPEKQPYAFTVHPPSSLAPKTFAFAGLWDACHNCGDDTWLQSFTIIAITPNKMSEEVHKRMPVILQAKDLDEWMLREGPAPVHLLKPFPAAEMAKRPVSKNVGNVRNNHPELLNSK